MTSPVDFISGPRRVSTSGNLLKGRTASFTETCIGIFSSVMPRSSNVLPSITFVASFAKETPVALLTNGIVLDALGLTSSTYNCLALMAYCTFIRPITFNSAAMAFVALAISSTIEAFMLYGGSTQAESPE